MSQCSYYDENIINIKVKMEDMKSPPDDPDIV